MSNNKMSVFGDDPGFFAALGNSLSDAICVVNDDFEVVHYKGFLPKFSGNRPRTCWGSGLEFPLAASSF